MDSAQSLPIDGKPQQGYFLEYQAAPYESEPWDHVFCGPHDVPGAWCPNCSKPLLRFWAFDARDAHLDIPDRNCQVVSLFTCWTCNIAQAESFYQLSYDGSLRFLQHEKGGHEPDFPYEDYPVSFPAGSARLVPIPQPVQAQIVRLHQSEGSDEEQWQLRSDIIDENPELFEVRHQLGGVPFYFDGFRSITCPICSKDMPFFVSVADDCLDPRGFTDNCGVQFFFHLCRRCLVVGSYHGCD